MALAVHAIQEGRRQALIGWLIFTMVLGMAFLSLKGLEYHEHISEGLLPGSNFKPGLSYSVEMFFLLYFIMTGLHTLHLTIGVGVLAVMTWKAWNSEFSMAYYNPIEMSGLYWSFIDMVWLFLWPLFYLIHP